MEFEEEALTNDVMAVTLPASPNDAPDPLENSGFYQGQGHGDPASDTAQSNDVVRGAVGVAMENVGLQDSLNISMEGSLEPGTDPKAGLTSPGSDGASPVNGMSPGSGGTKSPNKNQDDVTLTDPVKVKEREERIRQAKERAAGERLKKLEELRDSQRRADEFRKKQADDRKRKILELRRREEEHRQTVEERRRRLMETDNERKQAIIRRSVERDAKLQEMKGTRRSTNTAIATTPGTPGTTPGTLGTPPGRRPKSRQSDLTLSSGDGSPVRRPRPHSIAGRLPSYASPTVASAIRTGRSSEKKASGNLTVCFRFRSLSPAPKGRSKSADTRRSRADIQRTFERLATPRQPPVPPKDLHLLDSPHTPPKASPTPPKPAVPRSLPREPMAVKSAMASRGLTPTKGPVKAVHIVLASPTEGQPKASTPGEDSASPSRERPAPKTDTMAPKEKIATPKQEKVAARVEKVPTPKADRPPKDEQVEKAPTPKADRPAKDDKVEKAPTPKADRPPKDEQVEKAPTPKADRPAKDDKVEKAPTPKADRPAKDDKVAAAKLKEDKPDKSAHRPERLQSKGDKPPKKPERAAPKPDKGASKPDKGVSRSDKAPAKPERTTKPEKPAAKVDKSSAKQDKPPAKADKASTKGDKPSAKAEKGQRKAKSPVDEAPPSRMDGGAPAPAAAAAPPSTKTDAELEYKAKLAEKRRQAREKAEREAEEERRRLEEVRRQEEEQERLEEEADRKRMEEDMRLAAEARLAEEERLRVAIEAEERRKREEAERLERERKEKEEAEQLAREEAERKEVDRIERTKREDEERLQRKKRLEKIMKRVKTDDPPKAESPSSPSRSFVSPAGSSTPTEDEAAPEPESEPASGPAPVVAAPGTPDGAGSGAQTPEAEPGEPADDGATAAESPAEPEGPKFKSALLQQMLGNKGKYRGRGEDKGVSSPGSEPEVEEEKKVEEAEAAEVAPPAEVESDTSVVEAAKSLVQTVVTTATESVRATDPGSGEPSLAQDIATDTVDSSSSASVQSHNTSFMAADPTEAEGQGGSHKEMVSMTTVTRTSTTRVVTGVPDLLDTDDVAADVGEHTRVSHTTTTTSLNDQPSGLDGQASVTSTTTTTTVTTSDLLGLNGGEELLGNGGSSEPDVGALVDFRSDGFAGVAVNGYKTPQDVEMAEPAANGVRGDVELMHVNVSSDEGGSAKESASFEEFIDLGALVDNKTTDNRPLVSLEADLLNSNMENMNSPPPPPPLSTPFIAFEDNNSAMKRDGLPDLLS